MTNAATASRWKWCLVTSLAMVLLSMIPQIHLWVVRGRDWNGAYVSPQGDEPLYSGYINALIDGRARKNDPFGGRDDSPASPLPESTFSIQFLPAYGVALPARLFHVSASSAFIVLLGISAFFTSVALFWLFDEVTASHYVAAAGTLFVLCVGWIVGRYGIFNTFFDIGIPALHFLRRYQPAAAFPLFFAFQVMAWRALRTNIRRARRWYSGLAGLVLGLLIFSYLYLWTAAAAWVVSFTTISFLLRPSDRPYILKFISTVGIIASLVLIPYVYLVGRRPLTLDQQQTVISTHQPDLLRVHELLGVLILLLLYFAIRQGRIRFADWQPLFAASLAVLPIIVFNQQVVTGKAIQSFHFEVFVVNYSTLVGLFVTIAVLWKPNSRRFAVFILALSIGAGFLAVIVPSRLIFVAAAVENDRRIPVLLRLKELSGRDGTLAGLRTNGLASTLVFSPDFSTSRLLPTWTSQATLLDLGGVDFGNVTREERKELFFMHLYYSAVDPEVLRRSLTSEDSNPVTGNSARSIIFGHERVSRALSFHFEPIEPGEIEQEVQNYRSYLLNFSRNDAQEHPLTYAVIPIERNFDSSNLDHWYERDAGERVGDYLLYRLKLRPSLP